MGRTGKIVLVLVCLAIAAGAGYWVYREYWSPDSLATRMPPQKGRGGPMGAAARRRWSAPRRASATSTSS